MQKKGTPEGPFKFVLTAVLVRYNNVLCVAEVLMLHGNSVVTRSQVVLHNDSVATDDVFLSNFLRDDRLS